MIQSIHQQQPDGVNMATPLRSYRATTVPQHVSSDEVELQADMGTLPTLQVKAATALLATQAAHFLSGLPIFKIERIEVAQ